MEEKKVRSTSVYVKLSPEEREFFKELAHERGHKISTYLRHMIYKAMESEGIDVSAFKERN